MSLVFDYAGVDCKAGGAVIHYPALILPRTDGGVGGGIINSLRNARSRVYHVVDAVSLVNPRTLGVKRIRILVGAELLAGHVGGGYLAVELYHVFLKLDIVQSGVAEVKISLTVVVNQNGWVDISPVGTAQRLADSVLKWTCGRVGNGNAYRPCSAGSGR